MNGTMQHAQDWLTRYHSRNRGRAVIMGEIRTWDGADQWGHALGWWFAIADVLWHMDPSLIPADWIYRHAPGCTEPDPDDYPTADVVAMVTAEEVTAADLVYAGRILDRYTGWLRAAGQDY